MAVDCEADVGQDLTTNPLKIGSMEHVSIILGLLPFLGLCENRRHNFYFLFFVWKNLS